MLKTTTDMILCTKVRKKTHLHPQAPLSTDVNSDTTSGPHRPATAPNVFPIVFNIDE